MNAGRESVLCERASTGAGGLDEICLSDPRVVGESSTKIRGHPSASLGRCLWYREFKPIGPCPKGFPVCTFYGVRVGRHRAIMGKGR
jgi:hypothetical protein